MKLTHRQENIKNNQKNSAPRGGVWKSFARKPLVSIASLYFPPQGAGNYTQIIINAYLLISNIAILVTVQGDSAFAKMIKTLV
jgi:hypothetical protein